MIGVALALVPGSVAAHPFDVYPAQYELLARPGASPQRLVLATTYGLVLSDDGGVTWRWVCESAFGVAGSWAPEYEVTASGAITATTMTGLQVSQDGCVWTAAAGPAGAGETAAATAYVAGTLWLASVGQGAVIRRSDDDGRSWTAAAPLPGVLWIESIAVAPSDAQRVYVSGDDYPDAARVPRVWRSSDRGASWQPLDTSGFTTTATSSFDVLAIDPADPDRLFVKVSRTGAILEERLYRSIDGGATFTEVLVVNDLVTGVVVRDDGTVVAATPASGLFRSTDGGATFAPIAGVSLKATCLAEVDGALHVCADNFNPDFMGLGRSTDGVAWTPIMTMTALAGPLDCPAGTLQHDDCRTNAWCFFKTTYGIASQEVACATDQDAGVTPPRDPPPCGCGTGRPGASTALGLGLTATLWLRRRRRRAGLPLA